MRRVFISYSHSDRSIADRIMQDLRDEGLFVWIDHENIRVGDIIPEAIFRAIRDNEYLVILLSKNAVESTWVKEEINSAFMQQVDRKSLTILPVKIEDCEMPTMLISRRYADFTGDWDKGISELKDAMELPGVKIWHKFIEAFDYFTINEVGDILKIVRKMEEIVIETGATKLLNTVLDTFYKGKRLVFAWFLYKVLKRLIEKEKGVGQIVEYQKNVEYNCLSPTLRFYHNMLIHFLNPKSVSYDELKQHFEDNYENIKFLVFIHHKACMDTFPYWKTTKEFDDVYRVFNV